MTTLRKFGISSKYFSHYVTVINIYDVKKKEYKSIKKIIEEYKILLYEYINNLDFTDKEKLNEEFKANDLWILNNMLNENNEKLNKEFLLHLFQF
jgi:hypothetical protein